MIRVGCNPPAEGRAAPPGRFFIIGKNQCTGGYGQGPTTDPFFQLSTPDLFPPPVPAKSIPVVFPSDVSNKMDPNRPGDRTTLGPPILTAQQIQDDRAGRAPSGLWLKNWSEPGFSAVLARTGRLEQQADEACGSLQRMTMSHRSQEVR